MSDIQYVYPLIHNKVTSPHYVTPTLRRGRLLDWLNENATCRAMVIAADAGYGKTTMLWQWEQEVDFPCYWYKLDRNDRDWSLHISYLIEAISQRHEGFGRRAHSMLQQLGGPGSSRPGVAAYLLAEMHERLTTPCTFIIDDWQFVASVTEVRGLWNQILRDAPPTCRFVFLSRAKPHLQFARFKTHGGYAEMRTDALRFTDREIEELFREIYQDPLDPTELAELERRTEGWAASLQLVEVSLRERKSPEERRAFIGSIVATGDSDLVEFLAEEVLDQQDGRTRDFLLATSILQQIDPELAGRLAGVTDGAAVLAELELRGLFTYRLDDPEGQYRYHGLFRDFLEKRLGIERTEGEVAGLHIHAASFFETRVRWPEAIHHYMHAGLRPQAARLIAKYGEDMAAAGRLALLDKWLSLLPDRTVKENARLSLLYGEAAGVRGNWDEAAESLQRARAYFARKGDRRMQALAFLKLSTVYNDLGDLAKSSEATRLGLELVPETDHATRLRLRGNLSVTTTWLKSARDAEHECMRVAVESISRGYEQYAAIAYHNLGVMLRHSGRLTESLANLDRAARFWDASPRSPFADNSELVHTLLLLGDDERAEAVAKAAVARTAPWPRPHAEARYGAALVLAQRGRFAGAISALRSLKHEGPEALASLAPKATALLVECLYLNDSPGDEFSSLLSELERPQTDPRMLPITSVATAIAAHKLGTCAGRCGRADAVMDRCDAQGATLTALQGRLRLQVLAQDHGGSRTLRKTRETLTALNRIGVTAHSRWWVRRLSRAVAAMPKWADAGSVLSGLIQDDPQYWIPVLLPKLPSTTREARSSILGTIDKCAAPQTAALLVRSGEPEVVELRRRLARRFAQRLYVRSFGQLGIQRGSWAGPLTAIGRKRVRTLLGLLAAHFDGGLTREAVLESLWPDSEPQAAVNSLNQTVYQLRRLIEPAYREGESAPYVISNLDVVRLDPELVTTDLADIRLLARQIREPHASHRHDGIHQILDLLRGEYLDDLRYEEWVAPLQFTIHAEVRDLLLPIAEARVHGVDAPTAVRAGSVIATLDPYDESAHIAMAKTLAQSGRRAQSRAVLLRLAKRLRSELDQQPADETIVAAAALGVDLSQ